jgi:hypothetical protein
LISASFDHDKALKVLSECLGPDNDDEFFMEVHHGGFFYGASRNRVYLDGKVNWFDHMKVQY